MKKTMTSGLLAVAVASAMAPAHAQRSAFDRMVSDLMGSEPMPQGSDAEAANDPRSEIRVPFIRPNLNQRGQGLRIVDTESRSVMAIEPVAVQRYMRRHAMSPDSSHLMKDVPGVEVTGPGWVSGLPVIHGMTGPRLRLVVDGADLQGAYGPWLNPVLIHVNPARLARLRVYPGVAPVSMGGDSIGGAVVLESEPLQFATSADKPLRWGDGAYHARNNGLENDIRYRAVHATRSVHLSYQGNYAYSVNHRAGKSFYTARDGQPDGSLGAREIGSSRYITQTHRLGAVWRHDGHQLGIDGSWHGEPYQGLANQRMDVIRHHASTTGLRYQGDFGWGDVSARVWQQHARIDLGMGRDRQPADGLSSRLHGRDVGVNLKASVYVSPRDILRMGVDALYDRLDHGWRVNGAAGASGRTMVLILDDGRRERLSGFGEWERRWNGQWDTLVGVRATRVTTRAGSVQQADLLPNGAADVAAFNAHGRHIRDSHGDFSALAGFAPTLGQRYEIGVSRNTRSPSLSERYAWSTDPLVSSVTSLAGDGNGYLGNPDLKPEVATSAVAAAHWNPAEDPLAWGLSVSAHASRIRDYIDAERCPDSLCGTGNATATNQFVMLRYVNQDARIWGVDVWGHYRLVDFSLQGAYTMTGRMSWLRGRNEETRSGLYGIAPASIRLALEREQFFLFGLNKTTLEWEHVRASRDLPVARNAIPTEGFGLLHLRHRFALGGFGVDFGVENLLNRRYARPLGGAYLGQGDTRGLNTAPWGIPMPGQGRSFYFGLTYRM